MFKYGVIFVLLLVNSYQANAIVLNGSAAAFFDGGESVLEWGEPKLPILGGEKSSLTFISKDFSINDGNPFVISTLIYNNTEITQDSSLASTAMNLKLNFTSPEVIGDFVFSYDILITETDNDSSNPDDTVILAPASGFNPFFTLNGAGYSFSLLGFENVSDSSQFGNSFIQPENSNSSVDLYAKISAVPIPSAVWLFITALSGFFISNKRRAV